MNIRIKKNKTCYDINLKRSATILRGSSGSGKTNLCVLIDEYTSNPQGPVSIVSDMKVAVLHVVPDDIDSYFKLFDGYVFFIDETNISAVNTSGLYKRMRELGCWVVVITRDTEVSRSLECAVDSILELHKSGNYVTTRESLVLRSGKPINTVVKTEDSNSGYEFFKSFTNTDEPAGGKDWLSPNKRMELRGKLLAFDCAVLGPRFYDVYPLYQAHEFDIIDADSFEKLLLDAKCFDHNKSIVSMREEPWLYANDRKYYSWESYYEDAINMAMVVTRIGTYNKGYINSMFTRDDIRDSILSRNHLLWMVRNGGVEELRKLLPPSKQDISDDELLERYGNML